MRPISRRGLVRGASAAAAGTILGLSSGPAQAQLSIRQSTSSAAGPAARLSSFAPTGGPRSRVLLVNDLSGDVDGLFATVHALLSRSTDIRGIIGTGTKAAAESPQRSVELANEMLQLMGLSGAVATYAGGAKLADAATPVASAGARAIIAEAMRTDTRLPLYVTAGAGLSEVASALLIEPRIADRFTLVWIGGAPYPQGGGEFNLGLDPIAAQVVFNQSTVPVWQIPSDIYADCTVSGTELQAFVAPYGAVGSWLYDKVSENARKLSRYGLNLGETYTLGDSPLVLLTALNDWLPSVMTPPFTYQRTSSSHYVEIFAPHLSPTGSYAARDSGRRIRVYKSLDTRLMFSDFFAKMRISYGA